MTANRGCRGLLALLAASWVCLRHSENFSLVAPRDLAAALGRTGAAAGSSGRLRGAGRVAAQPRASLASRRALGKPGMPDFDLTGRIALVTGAGRGIGAVICEKLLAAGATVVGTGIDDEEAAAITEKFGSQGTGVRMNVVSPEDIDAGLKAIEDKFGSTPDILVNNAGITKDGVFLRMKESDWDAVINVNLNSVFRMTKACIKGMTKKRWGRVVSISSVVGSMGNAGQANYAASKAGMNGFSRALAREVGGRGITVNTVAPGFIDTAMTQGLKDEWKEALLQQVPVGRLGQADEIADAVLFLCAPSTGYITGQTLHVNGGMYMV